MLKRLYWKCYSNFTLVHWAECTGMYECSSLLIHLSHCILYTVQCTVQGQCPMYCTVSNVLYSAQCTVQCPITVQCPMYSDLYCTVCGEDDWPEGRGSCLHWGPDPPCTRSPLRNLGDTPPTPLTLCPSICTTVYVLVYTEWRGGGEAGNPPSSSMETPFSCLCNCFVGCILQ